MSQIAASGLRPPRKDDYTDSFPSSHLGTHSLLNFYFLLPRTTCQHHALPQ